MDADTYWHRLVEIGWLQFFPAQDHSDLRRRLSASSGGFGNPHRCFALAQFSFDWESILGVDSYVRLIQDLGEFSKGVFEPKNIQGNEIPSKSLATLSFSHKGKDYSWEVSMDSDYVDPMVLDLVNKAITESGSDLKFIDLPKLDQCAYLVLVPQEFYDRATAAGLIPPANASAHFGEPDEEGDSGQ